MKTIIQAFLDLAAHLETAKFDDPDEAQGAEEVVSRCLSEASAEERALLCEAASRRAAELRAEGASPAAIDFYERFVARVTNAA